jgi:hypothetical protein
MEGAEAESGATLDEDGVKVARSRNRPNSSGSPDGAIRGCRMCEGRAKTDELGQEPSLPSDPVAEEAPPSVGLLPTPLAAGKNRDALGWTAPVLEEVLHCDESEVSSKLPDEATP